MGTITRERTRTAAFHPEQAGAVGTGTATPGWDLGPERRIDDGQTLARGLGWFSLALGAAELVAPHWFADHLALDGREGLVRAYGGREIAAGVGLLARRKPAEFVYARIAGDALDLATLGMAWARADRDRRRGVALAIGAVLGATALDVLAAVQMGRSRAH